VNNPVVAAKFDVDPRYLDPTGKVVWRFSAKVPKLSRARLFFIVLCEDRDNFRCYAFYGFAGAEHVWISVKPHRYLFEVRDGRSQLYDRQHFRGINIAQDAFDIVTSRQRGCAGIGFWHRGLLG
jgi:hypothetical protein